MGRIGRRRRRRQGRDQHAPDGKTATGTGDPGGGPGGDRRRHRCRATRLVGALAALILVAPLAWAVPDTWGSTWTTDAEDDRATVQKTATGDAEADESATGEPGPGAGPAVMPPPLDSPSAKPAGSTLLETEYRWLVAILGLSTVVLLASGGLGVWFFSLNQQLSREADQRRSAEARYRMLIEAAPLPVLVLTMDGRRVLFANSRARGMLGNIVDLPAPPQTPRTDLALFASPEDGDALLRAVRKGTAVIDREMRLRRADGHALWVHMSADSISYEGDDAIFLAFADITARRAAEFRLRDSERRLRMLTENMVDVIWTLDESLHYTYISPSVRRLRGYTHDDIIGIAIDQVIQPDAYRRLEDFIRTSGESVRDTGTQAFMDTREEWELPCKGGGTVWTEVNIRIFFDEHGRFTGIQGMSRNISERRTLEEDLRRSNADLEQFAYAVSHDLQQPLRMVSQFLGLLKRRLGDDLEGEHREFLDFAVDGARHMHDMIKDLLEFSRVGRGEIQHDPLPLDRPLDQALHMLDATIREAGAIVERHPLPTVPGDEGQFTRLFQNLLDNALKYVAPDRRPHIVISAHAPREGWCEVSVADNGIGVDPRQVGRLFAVFQRLQPAGEYPGTGVGLAICRRIVERHGGRIRLESEGPHRGATVTFTLPAAPAADGRTDGPSPPAHPPTANG